MYVQLLLPLRKDLSDDVSMTLSQVFCDREGEITIPSPDCSHTYMYQGSLIWPVHNQIFLYM